MGGVWQTGCWQSFPRIISSMRATQQAEDGILMQQLLDAHPPPCAGAAGNLHERLWFGPGCLSIDGTGMVDDPNAGCYEPGHPYYQARGGKGPGVGVTGWAGAFATGT